MSLAKYGALIETGLIDIPGSDNSGPEALAYDAVGDQFHILQETPGTLLTLNREFEEIARRELKFAKDYSGISFDSERKQLWVMSDESKSIHVLDEDLRIAQTFSINIRQMEGLAIDHEARRMYVISDPLEMLYVFEFDEF